jgi:uncharacterized OsmC-like protein
MSYQGEIRTLSGDRDRRAMDPSSMRVQHHRAGQAELAVEKLSGGHLLHLALAGCVFNNLHAFATKHGFRLSDARVTVDGGFNAEGTASSGIACQIAVTGDASRADLLAVAHEAFDESSIVAVLRRTTTVTLSEVDAQPAAG